MSMASFDDHLQSLESKMQRLAEIQAMPKVERIRASEMFFRPIEEINILELAAEAVPHLIAEIRRLRVRHEEMADEWRANAP